MTNTFKIGDKFLLPVTLKDKDWYLGRYAWRLTSGSRTITTNPGDENTLIPASILTETADYLEALGDALTLMPPEMRDPRDVADEIREMLS